MKKLTRKLVNPEGRRRMSWKVHFRLLLTASFLLSSLDNVSGMSKCIFTNNSLTSRSSSHASSSSSYPSITYDSLSTSSGLRPSYFLILPASNYLSQGDNKVNDDEDSPSRRRRKRSAIVNPLSSFLSLPSSPSLPSLPSLPSNIPSSLLNQLGLASSGVNLSNFLNYFPSGSLSHERGIVQNEIQRRITDGKGNESKMQDDSEGTNTQVNETKLIGKEKENDEEDEPDVHRIEQELEDELEEQQKIEDDVNDIERKESYGNFSNMSPPSRPLSFLPIPRAITSFPFMSPILTRIIQRRQERLMMRRVHMSPPFTRKYPLSPGNPFQSGRQLNYPSPTSNSLECHSTQPGPPFVKPFPMPPPFPRKHKYMSLFSPPVRYPIMANSPPYMSQVRMNPLLAMNPFMWPFLRPQYTRKKILPSGYPRHPPIMSTHQTETPPSPVEQIRQLSKSSTKKSMLGNTRQNDNSDTQRPFTKKPEHHPQGQRNRKKDSATISYAGKSEKIPPISNDINGVQPLTATSTTTTTTTTTTSPPTSFPPRRHLRPTTTIRQDVRPLHETSTSFSPLFDSPVIPIPPTSFSPLSGTIWKTTKSSIGKTNMNSHRNRATFNPRKVNVPPTPSSYAAYVEPDVDNIESMTDGKSFKTTNSLDNSLLFKVHHPLRETKTLSTTDRQSPFKQDAMNDGSDKLKFGLVLPPEEDDMRSYNSESRIVVGSPLNHQLHHASTSWMAGRQRTSETGGGDDEGRSRQGSRSNNDETSIRNIIKKRNNKNYVISSSEGGKLRKNLMPSLASDQYSPPTTSPTSGEGRRESTTLNRSRQVTQEVGGKTKKTITILSQSQKVSSDKKDDSQGRQEESRENLDDETRRVQDVESKKENMTEKVATLVATADRLYQDDGSNPSDNLLQNHRYVTPRVGSFYHYNSSLSSLLLHQPQPPILKRVDKGDPGQASLKDRHGEGENAGHDPKLPFNGVTSSDGDTSSRSSSSSSPEGGEKKDEEVILGKNIRLPPNKDFEGVTEPEGRVDQDNLTTLAETWKWTPLNRLLDKMKEGRALHGD